MFSFQPTSNTFQQPPTTSGGGMFGNNNQSGLFGQPQQQSTLPTISATTIAPQPYPRDTLFDSLPIEIRNALEALEKTVMNHTLASKRVDSGREYEKVESARQKQYEVRETAGRLEVRQQGAKSLVQGNRRSMGQYWRYSEAIAASINSAANTASNPTQTSPTQKYSSLQLPPVDLQLFERIVDRLDGQLVEAESSACALRQELEGRSLPDGQSASSALHKTVINQQASLRVLREQVEQLDGEIDEDRKAFRRFLIKYRNDSSDPFRRQ